MFRKADSTKDAVGPEQIGTGGGSTTTDSNEVGISHSNQYQTSGYVQLKTDGTPLSALPDKIKDKVREELLSIIGDKTIPVSERFNAIRLLAELEGAPTSTTYTYPIVTQPQVWNPWTQPWWRDQIWCSNSPAVYCLNAF